MPIAFLTAESNLANLQASESQHMKLAIRPRLARRDEKLNEQLVPRFDPWANMGQQTMDSAALGTNRRSRGTPGHRDHPPRSPLAKGETGGADDEK
jgi:hypothetical protein